MKRRTLATGAALAAVAAMVAGCGRSKSGGGSGTVIGVDYPRSDSDFWNSYIKYVPQDGTALKLDLKTSNSENDVAKLAANVQTFISQGVKGVVIVRADNKAYGQKACDYLGTQLKGKGKIVMFEGDLASVNGRDRTDAFNQCMQQKYPAIKVFGEATEWKGNVAANKLQT